MAVVSISVANAVVWATGDGLKKSGYLSKGHTYISVLSREQFRYLDTYQRDYKVLFISPPAINKNAGHGDSKNTLVIFELKDDDPGYVPPPLPVPWVYEGVTYKNINEVVNDYYKYADWIIKRPAYKAQRKAPPRITNKEYQEAYKHFMS